MNLNISIKSGTKSGQLRKSTKKYFDDIESAGSDVEVFDDFIDGEEVDMKFSINIKEYKDKTE